MKKRQSSGCGAAFLTELRRVPIDFCAIAAESGCTRGTLCRSTAFGWGVKNGNGPADFCAITPPPMQPGETQIRISANELNWVFMGLVSPERNGPGQGRAHNGGSSP